MSVVNLIFFLFNNYVNFVKLKNYVYFKKKFNLWYAKFSIGFKVKSNIFYN